MKLESPINAANTRVVYTAPYPPTGSYRGTMSGHTVEFPAGNCVFQIKMATAVKGFGVPCIVDVVGDRVTVWLGEQKT